MENNRAQWSSKLGFILAAAGSAVGLGNIWKFPGKAFEGGGGAFLLMYLLIVPLIGMPAMLSELAVGRASQANVVDSFRKLGHKGYTWVGWMGWAVAF
ncbi:MAG: sodium-dependent transporter, partial [Oscillospiraceae bacterium]|nr:sodium-dependent transporter [Oscillospiraceae bacterium]